MRAVLIAACFLLAAVRVDAWWCTGHMVIAEIAKQNLDSGVESKVDQTFSFLNQWFSQTNNMISGACWADDLKSDKLETMAGWHFINQPYNPDHVKIDPWPIQEVNVETNIMSLGKTVQEDKSRQWITAFAVANLVHFYGDIHQPLHATELFDADFPQGDRGGNLFPVTLDGKEWRLHFIWDSVCGQYQGELTRPLSDSDYAYVKSLAGQYQANFSIPDADKKVWNATTMALESLEYAVKYAYQRNTLKPNSTLTSEYIEQCKSAAGFRIAAAGYRLAHELNYLFKSSTSGEAMLARVKDAKREYHRAVAEHGLRSRRN